MAVIGITGATDGIGRATAQVLLADGHRVLVHARSRERGEPILQALSGGDVALLVGDLARLDDVHRLADQVREHGPVDAWVHNAGVWVRGSTPRTSADGYEMTFAVNVLAPHLLTHLLSTELRGRLLWLGSGVAGSERPQPATLGRDTDPWRAYVESKACDVALALAWDRRLPDVTSAAVDPGWVKTKLASPGAETGKLPRRCRRQRPAGPVEGGGARFCADQHSDDFHQHAGEEPLGHFGLLRQRRRRQSGG